MASQTKTEKARAYTCGKCNKSGHNARSCPEGVAVVEKKQSKKQAAKKPAAESKELTEPTQDADSPLDTEGPALPVAQRDEGEDEAVELGPPTGQLPPGAKIVIPKRKRARTKAQEAFWSATEKKLAPNAVAEASELAMDIPRISTGNFGLDVALYGGIPQGRIVRFWGLPKSGKTGSCLNAVASYQQNHCSECYQRKCDCKDRDVPYVVWVDAENRMNSMLYWPEAHGINLDCMKIMTPPTGQNVVDFVDHIIREEETAKVGLIVVDSIAHIVSMDELNKPTLDGQTVGRSAYLMNQAWKRWTSAVHSLGIKNERKPTILCINQIRQKVGVNYGSPEIQPGGIGQDFATSIDIRFSSGPPTYVVWDEKKEKWTAKEKGFKSTFKPKPDQAPDFMKVNYRVTASGVCPSGRYGEFNYWLRAAHNHRCGDPDNGLQLWNYCKTYGLIEEEGHTKRLFGHEARTYDELMELFRTDTKAHAKAWKLLLQKLECRV